MTAPTPESGTTPVQCEVCGLFTGEHKRKMGGTFLVFDCSCAEVLQSLRNAPLSVLVQIPAVRELVEMYYQAACQWGDDYFWEKHGHAEFWPQWADALEASER